MAHHVLAAELGEGNRLLAPQRIDRLEQPDEFDPTDEAHGFDDTDAVAVEVEAEDQTDPVTKERIQNMLHFVESTSDWYEKISSVPTPTLQKLMKLGTGITGALGK